MANNGLKTFDDIMDYLSYLERKYEKTETELSEMTIGFFSADKKKLKSKKAKMEEELERITDIYDSYDKLFSESTTFERRDFSLFLARYFSLVYGKTFEVQRGVKDISESKYAKSCDFVASREDFTRIDKKYDLTKPVNLDNVMELCRDNCISLGGPSKNTILEDSEMNSSFSDFPEIIDAAKRLINIKLSNPNLSDKERLEAVLRDVSTEIELRKQEELLGASVRREESVPAREKAPVDGSPQINILRRSDRVDSSQERGPRIEILRRSDKDSTHLEADKREERPLGAAQTSTQESKPITSSLSGDKAMQDAIERALLSIQRRQEAEKPGVFQSYTSSFEEPESSSVVIPKPTTSESGGKKLTKSMMGMYMKEN